MNYPVDLHSHTVASTHAYSTIHDYIAEARRKGIRLFANTDHGPNMPDAPHYWHFVNLRVLPRIVDGVGILRGIEANILNEEGQVDAEGRMRDSLDIFLCGFHEAVFRPASREINTRAMVNTIRGGQVDIITHPGNTAFPIDIEVVVRAAAECGVALEVNNSSFNLSRKGSKPNCRAIVEAARDLGATLSLGSDAHVAFDLGNFAEADQLVREAGFPEARLLNTSPRRLLDFLEKRGRPPSPSLPTGFEAFVASTRPSANDDNRPIPAEERDRLPFMTQQETTPALGFDSTTFRRTLGMFATGIAVITARAPDGSLVGLTVSSFNSVSLEPPLILWSLANSSTIRDVLENCEYYAVNVLASDQEGLSNLFASKNADRFAGVVWEPGLGGAPLLAGCCAVFEVRNLQRYPGGDHVIFIGQVVRCERGEQEPLVFFGGKYRRLTEQA